MGGQPAKLRKGAADDVSKWTGVTVEGGRVVACEWRMQRLSGSIPPELSALSALKVLCLQANQLRGWIPPDLCKLTSLVDLRLHSCSRLCGALPNSLGDLVSLETLYLHGTGLSGEVSEEGRSAADTTAVAREQHSAVLTALVAFSSQIPPSLINLTKLKDLSLHSCKFTTSSAIPPSTIINGKDRIHTFIKDLTNIESRKAALMSDMETVEECWSALGGSEAGLKGSSSNPSKWTGVTVENSRVVKVDWSNLGLTGNLSEVRMCEGRALGVLIANAVLILRTSRPLVRSLSATSRP